MVSRAPPEKSTVPPPADLKDRMVEFVRGLQDRLVAAYERADGAAKAVESTWERPLGGGGGRMRVIRGERVEKAGANVSVIRGDANPLTGKPFFVTGVSTIVHPANPHAPTAHMNVRYFEEQGDEPRWWFGGGMDLTPMGFPYEEDTRHFRRVARESVASVDAVVADEYEAWADEYFLVKHRDRPRGVGGVFFDYRSTDDPERDFALARSVGERFIDAYVPILERRIDQPFTEDERDRQLRERGVYVEFNLLYDRGTRFGFESGGNVDAILVSLPPLVKW